jgi:hypothetical protein
MKRAALSIMCLCTLALSGCGACGEVFGVMYSVAEAISPSNDYGPVDPYAGNPSEC